MPGHRPAPKGASGFLGRDAGRAGADVSKKEYAMPAHIWIIDIAGIVLAALGLTMAFGQTCIRRLFGWGRAAPAASHKGQDDPLAYILRISGVMLTLFAVALASMVTCFHLESRHMHEQQAEIAAGEISGH